MKGYFYDFENLVVSDQSKLFWRYTLDLGLKDPIGDIFLIGPRESRDPGRPKVEADR